MTIRRYEPPDQAEVWTLHNVALLQVGAHLGNGPWDDDLNHIDEVYLRNGGEFLVGVEQGQIVAMAALKKTGDRSAEVKRVYPDCQRRGYGQAIMDALETRARELGFTLLHLDTTMQQIGAQQLYLKNGYQETGRTKVAHFDVILFEKQLMQANARIEGGGE